jgi:hypothetical protein
LQTVISLEALRLFLITKGHHQREQTKMPLDTIGQAYKHHSNETGDAALTTTKNTSFFATKALKDNRFFF